MNPDLDALITRHFVTVSRSERQAILADIVRHLTDQAVVIHLFYNALPQLVNRRLKNVEPQSTRAWIANAHLWEVQ
jgi:ABC-type transport system substrate-binding protein